MTLWASVPLWLLMTALGTMGMLLPRRWELRLGPWLGRIVFRLKLFKWRTTRDNIRHCYPELGDKGRQDLLRRNFEHYGNLFFEFLHFFSPVRGHYLRYARRNCVIEGTKHWDRALAKGKGVLFFSCHVGYWEMVAASAGLTGRPTTTVTTVLKPRWLDRLITACRLSTGVRAAYHPGSLPKVIKALRKGESVAFMNDQYAMPPMGSLVEFFGVQVNTLTAVAAIALRTGAAILPGSGYRDSQGVMRVTIEPELDLEQGGKKDLQGTTQLIADKVESWVRRHPDQWLWMHRRFKNVDWSARNAPRVPAVALPTA